MDCLAASRASASTILPKILRSSRFASRFLGEMERKAFRCWWEEDWGEVVSGFSSTYLREMASTALSTSSRVGVVGVGVGSREERGVGWSSLGGVRFFFLFLGFLVDELDGFVCERAACGGSACSSAPSSSPDAVISSSYVLTRLTVFWIPLRKDLRALPSALLPLPLLLPRWLWERLPPSLSAPQAFLSPSSLPANSSCSSVLLFIVKCDAFPRRNDSCACIFIVTISKCP